MFFYIIFMFLYWFLRSNQPEDEPFLKILYKYFIGRKSTKNKSPSRVFVFKKGIGEFVTIFDGRIKSLWKEELMEAF